MSLYLCEYLCEPFSFPLSLSFLYYPFFFILCFLLHLPFFPTLPSFFSFVKSALLYTCVYVCAHVCTHVPLCALVCACVCLTHFSFPSFYLSIIFFLYPLRSYQLFLFQLFFVFPFILSSLSPSHYHYFYNRCFVLIYFNSRHHHITDVCLANVCQMLSFLLCLLIQGLVGCQFGESQQLLPQDVQHFWRPLLLSPWPP